MVIDINTLNNGPTLPDPLCKEGAIEKAVVSELKEKGMTVSTAESCTGGLVSKRITAVSGSSSVFELGVTSYSGRIKNKILGVNADTIDRLGTVSAPVAAMMADGVRRLANADLGIATTGVAGDSFEGKPTGTVYVALADEKKVYIRRLAINKSADEREEIRQIASTHALDILRLYLAQNNDLLKSGVPVAEVDENL